MCVCVCGVSVCVFWEVECIGIQGGGWGGVGGGTPDTFFMRK